MTTWDAIVIGAGIGGLVTASQLVRRGASVLVLEKYLIPGGSAGYFERSGYRFDVGASMIFGFGTQGTTNLLTRALAAVDEKIETIPDPVQVHYHLPGHQQVRVHRDYEQFLAELTQLFPHEKKGIRRFYDECWRVFHYLNSMELLSLEEPRYLLRVFAQKPFSCLGLAYYLPWNVGSIARKHIHDPELLKFIDLECYIWSVVPAERTPMINAGMVFSDRHYGGINYPKGGVGQIAQKLAAGIQKYGGEIHYRSRVTRIITEQGKAVGVECATGQIYRAQRIISNATRWDTFGRLLPDIPRAEQRWRKWYQPSPSFLSLHLGVAATAIPPASDCHHVILDDWAQMEAPYQTLFVSIPTLLDPDLAPPGYHIVHAFTPCWLTDWDKLSPDEYEQKKETLAGQVIERLMRLFPRLDQDLDYMEVGTPRTHRRFLGRSDGTYGPMPRRVLPGLLTMPFNRTPVRGLYCVGDSTFPGQGLNAVAFSGFACAHRVATDLGL
ncbi:MAG: carotene isomerase [Gloeomargarita sp. DG_2_bins_126]